MPIYRQDQNGSFVPFEATRFEDLERVLEDWIENNPSLLLEGEPLAVFGRQTRSQHAKLLDLLAIDETGACVVIELKRGQSPRDVIAQTLEYAAWVDSLGLEELDDIARRYGERRGEEIQGLEEIYRRAFGPDDEEASGEAPDEGDTQRVTFNHRQRLVIVAEGFTDEVEQTLRYLRTKHGVDVSAVRFSIHRAGTDTLIQTEMLVGRETSTAAVEKGSRRGRGTESDESILSRVENEVVKSAVRGIEDWAASFADRGLEVRHLSGSTHALFMRGSRLAVYYFAKNWVHIWLRRPTQEEREELKVRLSDPGTVGQRPKSATFRLSTSDDLAFFQSLISARIETGDMA